MNWRRGLLRLWIVVAACWIGAVGVTVYFAETKFDIERIERRCIERQKAKGADIAKCTSKAEGDLFFAWDVGGTPATPLKLVRDWGSWALLPPFGLLLAGLAVTWIVAGFARDRRDKEAG